MKREEQIVKIADTIYRPISFWTHQVHSLLNHIQKNGFTSVPKPLGFCQKTNKEILTYIDGEIIYPLTNKTLTTEVVKSAAVLLKAYHDSTVSFVKLNCYDNKLWKLPPSSPEEVICHGDFAPYNVVFQK